MCMDYWFRVEIEADFRFCAPIKHEDLEQICQWQKQLCTSQFTGQPIGQTIE